MECKVLAPNKHIQLNKSYNIYIIHHEKQFSLRSFTPLKSTLDNHPVQKSQSIDESMN